MSSVAVPESSEKYVSSSAMFSAISSSVSTSQMPNMLINAVARPRIGFSLVPWAG
ncbi:hypothetical protein SANTM175S_08666 [Streptomyces antimycoticus]